MTSLILPLCAISKFHIILFDFLSNVIRDRSKIFGIFLAIYTAVFVLPVLVCIMADGSLGDAKWVAVLAPLWIWDFFILFYHSRVIMMGPIKRPDHIPEEEWVRIYFISLHLVLHAPKD